MCVCLLYTLEAIHLINNYRVGGIKDKREREKRGHVTDFFYCHAPLLVLFKFTRLVLQLTFNWLIKNLTKCRKRRSKRRRRESEMNIKWKQTTKTKTKLKTWQAASGELIVRWAGRRDPIIFNVVHKNELVYPRVLSNFRGLGSLRVAMQKNGSPHEDHWHRMRCLLPALMIWSPIRARPTPPSRVPLYNITSCITSWIYISSLIGLNNSMTL